MTTVEQYTNNNRNIGHYMEYDALTWEGDVSVIGGDDCNDDRPNAEYTYPGATGDPNVCAQDLDGDGDLIYRNQKSLLRLVLFLGLEYWVRPLHSLIY